MSLKPPLGLNIKKGLAPLSDFSIYLNNYCDYYNQNIHIEIPECNDNNKCPDNIENPYIISFNSFVNIMESKQYPKRIIMRGNDYKEYTYLVKGGYNKYYFFSEDLRLDSRIEEVFNVINVSLKNNNKCKEKNMKIKTYKVYIINIDYSNDTFYWFIRMDK